MNTPNQAQQEMFHNDIATLVSILNSNTLNKDLVDLTEKKIAERMNMYFNPMLTIKTDE